MKVGDKIGKLLLLEKIGQGSHKDAMWKCQCYCGKIFYRYTSSVKKGKSCGCDRYEDLTGKKFGKLTVIKKVENNKRQQTRWLCRCECGKETVVDRTNLSINKKKTYSCGCWRQKQITKHNKYRSKIYNAYVAMKQRCYNKNHPAYKYYGERGIKVCKSWLNKENGFVNFYKWSMKNGYKENLSIDRINVNGNYTPSNCRWASSLEQMNNTRKNRYITYNNQTHTVAEWARIFNIPYSTFYSQIIRKGVSIKDFIESKRRD